MKRVRFEWMLLVVSLIAFLAILGWTYDQLPQRVASHFNGAGVPDGWMSRSSYLWFMCALALGLSALVVGLFFSFRFFPNSTINLPRREYWLAPERRVETFDWLLRWGIWFACLELWFVLGLHLLLVDANASQPPRLSSAVWMLAGGFVLAIGGWIFSLFLRFFASPAH